MPAPADTCCRRRRPNVPDWPATALLPQPNWLWSCSKLCVRPEREAAPGQSAMAPARLDVVQRCSAWVTARSSTSLGVFDLGMGGVGELAELPGDQKGHLLADVDGVITDPLQLPRHHIHPHPPLQHALV